MPGWFADDPVEIFRRHVWINPFWEDDLASVVEWMGADRVLFGSDWPHIEALPAAPRLPAPRPRCSTPSRRRKVLLDNVVELTARDRPDQAGPGSPARRRCAEPCGGTG